MKYILSLILFVFMALSFAIDMPGDTEQFYVVQGVFDELEIRREDCEQQDAAINFACGRYAGDLDTFKADLADYVRLNLPGLYPATDWFDNLGGMARDYRSSTGQYLFAYNPDGLVVIAFVPK